MKFAAVAATVAAVLANSAVADPIDVVAPGDALPTYDANPFNPQFSESRRRRKNQLRSAGMVTATTATGKPAVDGVSSGIGNHCPANSVLKVGTASYVDMRSCECEVGWTAYAYPGWGCYKRQSFWGCPSNAKRTSWSPTGASFQTDCTCDEGYAPETVGGSTTCVYAYIFNIHGRVWLQFDGAGSDNEFSATEYTGFKTSVASVLGLACDSAEKACTTPADKILPYSIHKSENITADIASHETDHAGMILAHAENHVQASADASGISVGFAIRMDSSNMKNANDLVNKMKLPTIASDLKTALASDFTGTHAIESLDMFVWALTGRFWHPPATVEEGDACTTDGQCLHEFKCVDKPGTGERSQPGEALAHGERWDVASNRSSKSGSSHGVALNSFDQSYTKVCEPPYNWVMKINETDVPDNFGNSTPTLQPTSAPTEVPVEEIQRARIDFAIKFHCEFPHFNAKHNVTGEFDNGLTQYSANNFRYTKQQKVATLIGLAESLGVDPEQMSIQQSYENTDPWNEVYSPTHLMMHTKTEMLHTILTEASVAKTAAEVTAYLAQFRAAPNVTTTWVDQDSDITPFLDMIDANEITEAQAWIAAREAEPKREWPGVLGNFSVTVGSFTEAVRIHNTFKNDDTYRTALATQLAIAGFPVQEDCLTPLDEDITVVPLVHAEISLAPTPSPTPARQIPGGGNLCTNGVTMLIDGAARIQYFKEYSSVESIAFMDEMKEAMASSANTKMRQAHDEGHFQTDDMVAIKGCNIEVTAWNMDKVFIRVNPNPHRFGICACGPDGDMVAATFADMDIHNHIHFLDQINPATYLFVYTFTFKMHIPGTNMQLGNAIFDYIHHSETEYVGKTNTFTGAGEVVAAQYWANDGFVPSMPTFEGVNVTSIELTYVVQKSTPSPTPIPTIGDVDCVLSDWSQTTQCSHTCGGGGVTRQYRMVITPASGNGAQCGNLTMNGACAAEDNEACPVDCVMSEWALITGNGDTCTKSCVTSATDESYKVMHRHEETAAVGTGAACPTDLTKNIKCFVIPCPVDCKVGEWGPVSRCTKECNACKTWDGNSCTEFQPKGVSFQHRTIENVAFYGGKPCPNLVSDAIECNDVACAVDCVVSEWSNWGSCSETCAGKAAGTRLFGAHQERTRFIEREQTTGGRACPELTQKKLCGLHPCGAHVCTTSVGFPLTCTYEKGIVYTHHVNDVHDNELFMCYHNYVTEVCTCLCWPKTVLSDAQHTNTGGAPTTGLDTVRTSSVDNFDLPAV